MSAIMDICRFQPGPSALVVSMPHSGTHLPPDIAARLTPHARTLPDTDWNLPRLYAFLGELGASVLMANHSRYVIDLNRPADGSNLYPGQDTTALVPIDTSESQPLYVGAVPDASEIAARTSRYWQPYHDRLASTLAETKARHGYALLWDAHSIKPMLPRFFAGRLTDLNLGTADGRACGAGLGAALQAIGQASNYSCVLDGRYKGGHITRRFGQPDAKIHAVQLELSWATYMDEAAPFTFREELARGVRPVIRAMMATMLDWGTRHGAV